jgi:hypothetical protein
VEADLARYYHLDLRDRWRLDDSGCRRLTLRMIAVRVRHLPLDAATAMVLGGDGFTTTDYLLMDLFHGWTGKPHPMREAKQQETPLDPARVRKINAARKRMRDRIEAGLQPE